MNRNIHQIARTLGALVGPDGQTILYPLVEGMKITVDPGGGTLVLPIEVPESIATLAPYLQSVQALTALENASTNFRWKVIFSASITGRSWNPAVDLFAYTATEEEKTQAAYTTSDEFGRRMRYAIQASASTGTAGEGGIVWVYLALRLRT